MDTLQRHTSRNQHHQAHHDWRHSFLPTNLFRGVKGVFAHSESSCNPCKIRETRCEAVLKFPRGQYDATELSVNIFVDDTSGDNILQVRGETEQLFVIGDCVDTNHLCSTFDDGVFMITAPKHTTHKSGEPCFRPIDA